MFGNGSDHITEESFGAVIDNVFVTLSVQPNPLV
jgi:hypothetical protein